MLKHQDNKRYLKIVIGVIFLIAISCNLKEEVRIADPELIYVLAITDCDSLLADEVYMKHNEIKWPETKPKTVVEAVLKLNSMMNEYNKHVFRICDPMEFYFGFGMGIRNEWVHTGNDEFKDQLFNKLKIGHADSSSGLILGLFNEYLKEGEINFMNKLGDHLKADSMINVWNEFKNIEIELNRIKKENDR